MTQYKILTNNAIDYLAEDVNKHIAEGWTPIGGICTGHVKERRGYDNDCSTTEYEYAQAMINDRGQDAQRRRCTFRLGMGRSTDEQKTGWFHRWGTTAYENGAGCDTQFVSETVAIVEDETGKIYTPFPTSVQFIEEPTTPQPSPVGEEEVCEWTRRVSDFRRVHFDDYRMMWEASCEHEYDGYYTELPEQPDCPYCHKRIEAKNDR